MTKIAYGSVDLADLQSYYDRHNASRPVRLTTRYRPTRADDMVGGSLYWIIAHHIVARSTILAFEDAPDGRHYIVLEPRLIPVAPLPRRAHQGWRYLTAQDAPPDLPAGGDTRAMPLPLRQDLARLGLL